MNGVHWIELVFQIKRPLSLEEARTILIDAVEEIREKINNHEGLRPYLDSWPVDHRIAHVGLWVSDKRGNEVYAPMIGQACVGGGPVVYWQNTPDGGWRSRIRSEESYEEALRIVKGGG